jgi:hypothetical protein
MTLVSNDAVVSLNDVYTPSDTSGGFISALQREDGIYIGSHYVGTVVALGPNSALKFICDGSDHRA